MAFSFQLMPIDLSDRFFMVAQGNRKGDPYLSFAREHDAQTDSIENGNLCSTDLLLQRAGNGMMRNAGRSSGSVQWNSGRTSISSSGPSTRPKQQQCYYCRDILLTIWDPSRIKYARLGSDHLMCVHATEGVGTAGRDRRTQVYTTIKKWRGERVRRTHGISPRGSRNRNAQSIIWSTPRHHMIEIQANRHRHSHP